MIARRRIGKEKKRPNSYYQRRIIIALGSHAEGHRRRSLYEAAAALARASLSVWVRSLLDEAADKVVEVDE